MLAKKAFFSIFGNLKAWIYICKTFLRAYFVVHDYFSPWRFRLYSCSCFFQRNIGLYIDTSIIYKDKPIIRWTLLFWFNPWIMFEYTISIVRIISIRFSIVIKIKTSTFHLHTVKLSSNRTSLWWYCLLYHIHYVATITSRNKATFILHGWRPYVTFSILFYLSHIEWTIRSPHFNLSDRLIVLGLLEIVFIRTIILVHSHGSLALFNPIFVHRVCFPDSHSRHLAYIPCFFFYLIYLLNESVHLHPLYLLI